MAILLVERGNRGEAEREAEEGEAVRRLSDQRMTDLTEKEREKCCQGFDCILFW
jgi:hypothetical protein